MSAGICGKRVGFEEIFGSAASSSSSSSAKRSRCSSFGSSDIGFGSEDKISILLRMFPTMGRELVESVLNTHGHKIEDATESLQALCLGGTTSNTELQNSDAVVMANSPVAPDNIHISEQRTETLHHKNLTSESRIPMDGSSWVEFVVQEMANASDINDARGRISRILEIFEKSVIAHSKTLEEQKVASLKEHLESMLRDNQILKRAVAIQHERNLEQEGKVREVEQLKHVLNQHQEQLKTLEMNNYTLKLHLQRAQESNSIPGQFHPDVF